MRLNRILAAGFVFAMILTPSLMLPQQKAAAPAGQISPQLHKDLLAAAERGVVYLIQNQKADGCWENHVGITALAATAILKQPGDSKHKQGPEVKKALSYIAGLSKPDGGIYGQGHENYSTATSVMALVASGNPAYKPLIEKGQKYMAGIQLGADGKTSSSDKNFGGIGYNGQQRPDLPNLAYALEALKASGVPENSPVWQRAVQFIQRTQNRSETNDQSYTGNDGGFAYGPGLGWEGTETRSYGSMTYAGLLSYSFANIKKGDPRVEAAVSWIKKNYTLEENPGVGQKTLYYYYMVFAKALRAYGDPILVDAQGRRHNWSEELGRKLLEVQHKEGYWVNTDPAEWQDNKVLVTAFTLIALEHLLQ